MPITMLTLIVIQRQPKCPWTVKRIHMVVYLRGDSLVAQLVKISICNAGDPGSILGKIPWRRDRLPTLVFLGFSSDSAGKESIQQ